MYDNCLCCPPSGSSLNRLPRNTGSKPVAPQKLQRPSFPTIRGFLSYSLFLSLSSSICVSLSPWSVSPISLSLSVCVFLSLSLCVFLSFTLSLLLSVSLALPVAVSGSLGRSVPPSLLIRAESGRNRELLRNFPKLRNPCRLMATGLPFLVGQLGGAGAFGRLT